MNIEQERKNILDQIHELQSTLNLIQLKRSTIETCPFKITFSNRSTHIIIHKVSELHEAREFMRRLCGTWTDELKSVFFSGNAIAVWRDPDHDWSIRLVCPLKKFPEELLPSDTCKWAETTVSDYHVQCSMGDSHE